MNGHATELVMLGGSLVVYCVIHSILADDKLMGRLYARWWYRLFYVAQSLVLLVPVGIMYFAIESHMVFDPGTVGRIILGIIWFGALFAGYLASKSYDNLDFLGIAQVKRRFTENRHLTTPHDEMIESGALRIVRHPYYAVGLVLLWARPLAGKDLVVSTILSLYFIIGAINEERKLVKHFGDAYRGYRKRVPMFVPFLKGLPSKGAR